MKKTITMEQLREILAVIFLSDENCYVDNERIHEILKEYDYPSAYDTPDWQNCIDNFLTFCEGNELPIDTYYRLTCGDYEVEFDIEYTERGIFKTPTNYKFNTFYKDEFYSFSEFCEYVFGKEVEEDAMREAYEDLIESLGNNNINIEKFLAYVREQD